MCRHWAEHRVAVVHGSTVVPVRGFGPADRVPEGMLTWVEEATYALGLRERCVVFCPAELAEVVRARGSVALVDAEPRRAFWRQVVHLAPSLSRPRPVVDRTVGAHPTAVIGSAAFKVIEFDGAQQLAPVLGGVRIGAGVTIGAHSCVDAGIFGEDTEIGEGVQIDNLVHVGHSAVIGRNCLLMAGTIVGGWDEIGERSRIVSATLRNGICIGKDVLVGWGSNVVKDVPDGAMIKGNPARIFGWRPGYGG